MKMAIHYLAFGDILPRTLVFPWCFTENEVEKHAALEFDIIVTRVVYEIEEQFTEC